MTRLQDFTAAMIQNEAQTLERLVKCMPEDKAAWSPLDKGRTVIDQIVECGGFGLFAAQVLEARTFPEFDVAILEQMKKDNDTVEKALALLRGGTEAFVTAVRNFPDDELHTQIDFPFQPGTTKSFIEFMMMVYWNAVYHEGQINYIQTLYGDNETH